MSENKQTQLKNEKIQTVSAAGRNLRISPRKMRLVTSSVKGMKLEDAITKLQFMNKKGAEILRKVLLSLAANAEHNYSLATTDLYIQSAMTDMGEVMKRFFPRARGSAFIIRRKMAHVQVLASTKKPVAKKKTKKKLSLRKSQNRPLSGPSKKAAARSK